MPAERTKDLLLSVVKAFAQKGNLLSPSTLRDMAQVRNLEDLVTMLKGTVYNPYVSKVSRPYTATKLELGFRESLADLHDRLAKITPNSQLLSAYYLKYIASNLKTVLKGKALGRAFEETVGHLDLHAEELVARRDIIAKALSAPNLDAVSSILSDTEFGAQVEAGIRAYKETGNLQVLDLFIDGALYREILRSYNALIGEFWVYKAEPKTIRDIVAVDVDGYNVMAVLRGKYWELEPSGVRELLLLPGFDVHKGLLERMIEAKNNTEAMGLLETTPYRSMVPEFKEGEEPVSALEEAFLLLSYSRARKPFLYDVFGLSLALGIIKMKELEMGNLSSIAFGVERGADPQAITAKLVAVK